MLNKLINNIANHICHDLASGIGAVDSNVEFLEHSQYSTDALEIIKQGSIQSVSRLKFLRYFYGSTGQEIKIRDLINLTRSAVFLSAQKVLSSSEEIDDTIVSGFVPRILLGFLYLASGDLPYGGKVHVSMDDSGRLQVSSIDERYKPRPQVYHFIFNPSIEEGSCQTIVASYIGFLNQEEQHNCKIDEFEDRVVYSFDAKK